MKILKIKYYKRPTLKTGTVSANTGCFTIPELEDAKLIIETAISAHRSGFPVVCPECGSNCTDGTKYCETCDNEIK